VGELDNSYNGEPEPGNQLASIDLAYSFPVGKSTTLKLYTEGTAEDQNVIMPFQFARLIGATIYGSHGDKGAHWRATFEYSDTVNTLAWIIGKRRFNGIYVHHLYRSGYNYHSQPIGHSLYNDTRLLSFTAEYRSQHDWRYVFKYHNAIVNMDGKSFILPHLPTKNINVIEADISKSFSNHRINLKTQYIHNKNKLSKATNSNFTIEITWTINLTN
jgi:hypothetical protein